MFEAKKSVFHTGMAVHGDYLIFFLLINRSHDYHLNIIYVKRLSVTKFKKKNSPLHCPFGLVMSQLEDTTVFDDESVLEDVPLFDI